LSFCHSSSSAGSETTSRSAVHRPAFHKPFCDTVQAKKKKEKKKRSDYDLRIQCQTRAETMLGSKNSPPRCQRRISRPLALGLRATFGLPGMPVKLNHRNAAAQELGSRETQRGFTPIVAKRLKRKTSTWRMAHGVGNIGVSCIYALTFSSRVCHLDIFGAAFLFCFHPSLLAFSLGISHTLVCQILAATLSVELR
jgi:hypothetical protein